MDLFYRETGAGNPIIILHGLFGTSDNWQIIARKMGETHRIITADLRNHGQSFHSDEFGYGLMAKDVEKLIDHLQLNNPVIIGHSMGGKVALRSSFLFPDKISKVISVDMAPKYYPVRHERIIEALKSAKVVEATSRNEIDEQLSVLIPEMGERLFLMKNLKRKASGGFEWKMNLEVISDKIENLGEAVHEGDVVLTPTLFLRGGKSDYILDSDEEEILKHFPNSRIQTIADAGHWVHADKPLELMDAIYEFIN